MTRNPTFRNLQNRNQIVWNRIAYSVIDGDHVNGYYWTAGDAELQKMLYRFLVANTETNGSYRVDWDVITWDVMTGQVDIEPHSYSFTGTGDPAQPFETPAFEALPPDWDQSRDVLGSPVLRWVDNVNVSQAPVATRTVAGAGPYAGSISEGGGGCATCGSGVVASARAKKWGGLSLEFSMGPDTQGRSSPNIEIFSVLPSTSVATPASIFYSSNAPDTEVIWQSGSIRQVKAAQALANIITNSAFSYEIRYYLTSQVGALSSGVYTLSGDPFLIWRVENPDASSSIFNQVKVTEMRDSTTNVYNSVYSSVTGSWKVGYPGGLREDEWTSTVSTNGTSFNPLWRSMPGYQRTVTVATRVPGGPDLKKTSLTYARLNFGDGLTAETVNPDTAPETTSYVYYNTGSHVLYGPPIQKTIRSDGPWEWHNYFDGRLSSIYFGVGNLSSDGSSPPGDARRRTFDYTPISGAGDDGTLYPDRARTITEDLAGYIYSTRYEVPVSAEITLDIQVPNQSVSSGWNDPKNLFTTNRVYTTGPNANRLRLTVRPDGTLQTFNYAVDSTGAYHTNMTATGQPGTYFTNVVDGTTNWTVVNSAGQPVISVTKDVVTGVVLSQEVYSNFDGFGRPGRVTHLDGTHEDTAFACCGVDSTTDRDGVTTQYGYDSAKRQITQTRLSITTSNVLDGAGRTVKTVRYGTDGSPITTGQWQFRINGDVINETNALSGVTSYSWSTNTSTGERTKTTTYPDGGTRIELYYRDGTIEKVTGTAVAPTRYEYGVEVNDTGDADDSYAQYTLEIKLAANGADTSEWTRTYTDSAGRAYKTMYSDVAQSDPHASDFSANPFSKTWFNNKGQAWKQMDPDGVINFTTYNSRGEAEYQIQAVANATCLISSYTSLTGSLGTILSGPDRVTYATQSVVAATGGKPDLTRNDQYVWNDGSSTGVLISRSESSTDGLKSWQTMYPTPGISLLGSNVTVYAGSGLRYSTNVAPDGSYGVTTFTNGRAISMVRKDSGGTQLSGMTQGYDVHGRQNVTTDARSGSTVSTFNSADLTVSGTTPSPGNGASAQTTTTSYDASLRAWKITQPDGSSVTNEFYPTGLIKRMYGSRNYPVGYGYDAQQRMTSMTNWTNFATSAGSRVTSWNYNAYRGWLDSKRYPDGNGPDYTYSAGGRLKTRKWARTGTGGNRIETDYKYGFDDASSDHQHGDLISIAYSYDPQSTPTVNYVLDRRGRQLSLATGTSTNLMYYNDANQMLNETNKTGTLAGLSITNGFDQFMRKTNVVSLSSGSALTRHSFGYDPASRMSSATDNSGATAYSATYSYVANSPLVGQIVMKSASTTRLTVSKQYDRLNRLLAISNAPSAASPLVFGYALNDANQRIQTHLQDNSFWVYSYDALGQVISGKKYWSDWTPIAGQQFEYGFDDIGNRSSTKAGGDENGANVRFATYTANSLNQYSSRSVPNAFDVIGLELATNSVTVNGATPYRHGEYFRKEVSVVNSSTSVWQSVTVSAPSETTVTGNVFVPKTSESFGYDLDGNMTNDGRFTFTWDGENRLLSVQSLTNGPQTSWRKVTWEFDGKGRRIRQTSYNGSSGSYFVTDDLKFLADGWRHVAELNATNNALVRSYLWGLDLSGTTDGAGGIGGLVLMNSAANGIHFAVYDGNGNVAGLAKGTDGTVSATYEYWPFGETLRATGAEAREMPFRFSTKRTDNSTDLLLYEYRIYGAVLGRWLNADPIEEQGGMNLVVFLNNSALNSFDPFGNCGGGEGGTPTCKVLAMQVFTPAWLIDKKVPNPGKTYHWDITLPLVVTIRYANGPDADPSRCRYLQWVRERIGRNGDFWQENNAGLPLDGQWHVDKNPWKDDTFNGAVYTDSDPAPEVFKFLDSPGVNNNSFAAGDQVYFSAQFRVEVYDKDQFHPGGTPVASGKFHIGAKGTYPNALVLNPSRTPVVLFSFP